MKLKTYKSYSKKCDFNIILITYKIIAIRQTFKELTFDIKRSLKWSECKMDDLNFSQY